MVILHIKTLYFCAYIAAIAGTPCIAGIGHSGKGRIGNMMADTLPAHSCNICQRILLFPGLVKIGTQVFQQFFAATEIPGNWFQLDEGLKFPGRCRAAVVFQN